MEIALVITGGIMSLFCCGACSAVLYRKKIQWGSKCCNEKCPFKCIAVEVESKKDIKSKDAEHARECVSSVLATTPAKVSRKLTLPNVKRNMSNLGRI